MSKYVLRFEQHLEAQPQGRRPIEFKYAIRRADDDQLVFRAESKKMADELMAGLRRKQAA